MRFYYYLLVIILSLSYLSIEMKPVLLITAFIESQTKKVASFAGSAWSKIKKTKLIP